MLPPKIGEGVFGSSCGGVKPAGAFLGSTAGSAVWPSARMAVLEGETADLSGLVKEMRVEFFHDELGVVRAGVNREACVAMAILREFCASSFSVCEVVLCIVG